MRVSTVFFCAGACRLVGVAVWMARGWRYAPVTCFLGRAIVFAFVAADFACFTEYLLVFLIISVIGFCNLSQITVKILF